MPSATLQARDFLRHLSRVFLMGAWAPAAMTERVRLALGKRRKLRWAAPLSELLFSVYPDPPGLLDVLHVITADPALMAWCAKQESAPSLDLNAVGPDVMAPAAAAFYAWELPSITTPGALAEWLQITPEELEWFADRFSWERCRRKATSRHYDYHWRRKPGNRWRLIEAPRPRLKAVQRTLLHGLLDRVPVHEAAHGFCAGRSCATSAATHAGKDVVWKLDLRHFFPSIRRPRIRALWRSLGYPDGVAELLAALVTNAVPASELDVVRAQMSLDAFLEWERVLTSPHLPQGAPTSPALANLVAFRLDCRLRGLAAKTGVDYSRYADDLAFSGDRLFTRTLPQFRQWVLAILLDEGFSIQDRKTRTMAAHEQQQLTGLVVNVHPQPPRKTFDDLRALLYNCVRFGPQSQNRDRHAHFRDHLLGRINAIGRYNLSRKARLSKLFEQIDWNADANGSIGTRPDPSASAD